MKILVVDDEKPICDLIDMNLSAAGYFCKTVQDGLEAIDIIEKEDFDLILLDIMLPGADGFDIMEYIRPLQIPVIFITAKNDVRDKVRGLKLGAEDYLAKPFGVMELIARVKALLRRSGVQEERKLLQLEELSMDDEKHAVYVKDKHCELTFKEYELLKMLLENVGIVLNRESIMSRIWGTDYMGETRTVDMHIKTLRQKLGEAGNHIKTVRNVGYMIE